MFHLDDIKYRIIKVHKPFLLLISFALILSLGYVDYRTGVEYSFSLFYLLPIMSITWFRGEKAGIVCSLSASLIWFIAEKTGDRPYSNTIIPYWNSLVRLSFFIIITLLIQRIRKLYNLLETNSKIDNLTGFHNNRSFYEQLSVEIKKFQRTKRYFSLAYIDIDNFKQVNDSYGHDEGNILLKSFAHIVRSSIREEDIPGRIGGDEFVILFSETDEKQVQKALNNIVQNLHENLPLDKWKISFSIGVITFHTVPDTIDALIKKSDELMYKAKKDGKNRIYSNVYDKEPDLPPGKPQ